MAHRIATIACAAVLGIAPAAAVRVPAATAAPASPTPVPTVAYQPCPMTAAAQAVAVPHSTLPQPSPRDPTRPVVGGGGLATAGLTVPAAAPPLPAILAARSWLVADLASGTVIGACGPHEQRAPASVQKLLLAATVLPRLDPNQVVQVTREDLDIEPGSSAVGLVTGGSYSIQTLWLGLLLVSGNDAANVLARLGGGQAGVPGTMQAMNDLAHRLGARDTHAVTPHGLDAAGQFTSAYDLALIARACLEREDFRGYELTRSAQIPAQPPKDPRGFQIQNDNLLVYNYPGALGGKTGFTDVARHTYVGMAERNGRRLVVTLLGAETVSHRTWQQGAALLDWGFSVAAGPGVGRLVDPGEIDASGNARSDQQRRASGAGSGRTGGSSLDQSTVDLLAAIVAVPVLTATVFVFTLLRRRRARPLPPTPGRGRADRDTRASRDSRAPVGRRPPAGNRLPTDDRRPTGERRPPGDPRPTGDPRPSGDPRPTGDRRPIGERRPIGDPRPTGDRPRAPGGPQVFRGRQPTGNRQSPGDPPPRAEQQYGGARQRGGGYPRPDMWQRGEY